MLHKKKGIGYKTCFLFVVFLFFCLFVGFPLLRMIKFYSSKSPKKLSPDNLTRLYLTFETLVIAYIFITNA